MAIKYRVDQEMGVVYVNMSGVVKELEFITAAEEALHDPKCYPGINFMINFLEIERFEVSNQTIRHVVGLIGDNLDEYERTWKVAIVAPTGPVYGLSQMYQLLRKGSMEEIGIFQNAESAREWLGLPEEETGS